jgi:hypothetical protein
MPTNRKDVQEILDAAADQGWRVDVSSKGYKLYAPSGSGIVLIHKTPSARNWQRKAVSQMKKYDANFKWKGR